MTLQVSQAIEKILEDRRARVSTAFIWIWSGQAVSMIGSQLSAITFQLIAVTSLHATATQMGLLTAAQTFPYLVLGLFIGLLVDSTSRRMLLLLSDFSRSAVLVTASYLALRSRLDIHMMLFVVCITATFNLIFDASLGAYIPQILPLSQWSKANARMSATVSAGEIGGPALGGLVVNAIAVPFVIFIDALSYFLSAVCILISQPTLPDKTKADIFPGVREPSSRGRNPFPAIRDGVSFVVRHPILRILALWSAVWNFAWSAVMAVLVLYASRTWHISATGIGLCFAAGGLGGVGGATFANLLTKRFSCGQLLVSAPFFGAFGALVTVIPRGNHVVMLACGLFLFNAGQSAFSVNMQTTRQRATPMLLMGRMDTVMRLCFTGMSSVGALAGGAIASVKGPHASIVFGVVGLFIAAAGLRSSHLAQLVEGHPSLIDAPSI